MWVYQESAENKKTLAVQSTAPDKKGLPAEDPLHTMEPVPPVTAGASLTPPERPIRKTVIRRIPRDCAVLAVSYLFGTLLSGVILALCHANELSILSTYLSNWSGLFTLDEPKAVWSLFGAEYLTTAGGATILLLLGLSAFGPVLIYLFAMLFGLGIGIIELYLFLQVGWKNALLGLLLTGIPTAAAVTCLCLFGASALGVSGRLQHAAFSKKDLSAGSGARRLLGQYLVLNVLFLPICGTSTALTCLVYQLSSSLAG